MYYLINFTFYSTGAKNYNKKDSLLYEQDSNKLT